MKKEATGHGFEPLTSWKSKISFSTAPSVTYCNYISCEFNISVEISAVNICKICDFSGKIFFSPHSAGTAETYFFQRILLVAVKNFLSSLKRWRRIFHRLKFFFSVHSSHWTQILQFYTNSSQILHLLEIFSGDTSTRELSKVFSWVHH